MPRYSTAVHRPRSSCLQPLRSWPRLWPHWVPEPAPHLQRTGPGRFRTADVSRLLLAPWIGRVLQVLNVAPAVALILLERRSGPALLVLEARADGRFAPAPHGRVA